MKNNILHTLLYMLPAACIMFTGCEKVIDLDLEDAKPVLVIEGGVSNQSNNQVVKISKTIPFDKSNTFNAFSGAVISLTTSSGQKFDYTEVSPGIYQTARFRGIPGLTYTLQVNAEGKTYTASSVMPQPVRLDSINLKQFYFLGDTNIYAMVNYTDPPLQNQYRHILKVKNKVEHETITEDRFNDGNAVSDVIFYELNDFKPGDQVEVEMQCIDRNVFKYFYALSQISGEGGPPVAPANPVSNFDNGALGIFSAYTTSRRSLVIK